MRTRGRRPRVSRHATLFSVVFVALMASGAAMDARGQERSDSKAPSIVVDGTDWLDSNADERRAFLVGVANMIVAEGAYAKRNGVQMPPVSDRIVKAVAKMKLTDIEARITNWYEANPEKKSTPVMGVVWHDIVGH